MMKAAASVTLVFALLLAVRAYSEPVTVTIGELVTAPERYAGKEVAFEGILVRSTELYTVEKSDVRVGTRIQLALSDMTGAQVLVLAYAPSYDVPKTYLIGKTGTPYLVRGIFYRIPVEPGPPLLLVAVPGKNGLRKK